MFEPPSATISPPLLSGHAVTGPDQVVLGPATLAAIHKQVGDSVEVSYEGHHGTLHIVGTATLPAIGINGTLHPSTGSGAVASTQVLPQPPDPLCGRPTRHGAHPDAIVGRSGCRASGHAPHYDRDEPDLLLPARAEQLLRRRCHGVARPASSGNHRLPHHGLDAHPAGGCAGTGGRDRAWPDACELCAAPTARFGDTQSSGVHEASAALDRVLAVVADGRSGGPRRHTGRRRARSMVVDPIRPGDLCRPGAHGTRAVSDPHRHRGIGLRKHCRL